MKKLLFTLAFAMCVSSAAFAQFSNGGKTASNSFFSTEKPEKPWSYGVRAGLNLSSASISILGANTDDFYTDDGLKSKVGFNVGLNVEYSIFKSLSIKSGIYLTSKGAKYENEDTESETSYYELTNVEKQEGTANEYYIQIPILASYKYYIKDNLNLEFNFGPYLAYGIAGKSHGTVYRNGIDVTSQYYEKPGEDTFGKGGLKRFDSGLIIGVGITHNKYYAGVQYDLGMTNLVPSRYSSVCSGKNRNFSVNIGYNF